MREMPLAVREYVDSLSPEGEDRVLGERLTRGFTYPVDGGSLGMTDRCLLGAGEDFQSQEDFVQKMSKRTTRENGALMAVGLAFDLWAEDVQLAGAAIRQRILDNRLARSGKPAAAMVPA